MKIKRMLLMALVFTVALGFVGIGTVKALEFEDWVGAWWKVKYSDKGYVFSDVKGKALKYSAKTNAYSYINGWNPATKQLEVWSYEPDGAGGWAKFIYPIQYLSGTPSDTLSLLFIPPSDTMGAMMTVHITMKEDKKNPGAIKSGKGQIVGSAMYMETPGGLFVGKRDMKLTFIPESKVAKKVPDAIQTNGVPNPDP